VQQIRGTISAGKRALHSNDGAPDVSSFGNAGIRPRASRTMEYYTDDFGGFAQMTAISPGAGKYENTLNWLIQTAPQSARYPFVKSPRAIFFVATREEVEKRDISRFMANFGPQIPADKMREYQGNIFWTVDGYDSDPAELHDIPEVRDYYADVHRRWPAWLFFADLRTECLMMVARCIIPSHVKRGLGFAQELQAFFDHGLPPAAWFHKRLGIPPESGDAHLQQVARYLGLLE
jgi:hypothetical protein